MNRRPTIVDVARKAGVSKSTVSNVLQGSPLVRPETRDQVRAAIAELDYVYNRAAANLRGGDIGLIGLVINDLRNPFFTEFAASAQLAFAARGFATVIAHSDENPEIQAQVVTTLIEHGLSALVISPTYGDTRPTFDALARAGAPTLQVLRLIDPRTDLFPFASLDYAGGSLMAAEHLLALGARRIAFVGGVADRPVTAERMSGYLEVTRREGIPPLVLHDRPSRAFGRDAALRLAAEHPEVDAAICFSDLVALGMLAGFAQAGVEVGTRMRVCGFDDIEEAALAWPQLTSVRCDVAGFAEETAEAMLAWLETGLRPPAQRRVPVTLAPRRSTLGV
jgi:LacI family transcriptional regulator